MVEGDDGLVILPEDPGAGRRTGEAYITFKTAETVEKAIEKNRFTLGARSALMSLISLPYYLYIRPYNYYSFLLFILYL